MTTSRLFGLRRFGVVGMVGRQDPKSSDNGELRLRFLVVHIDYCVELYITLSQTSMDPSLHQLEH